MPLFGDDPRQTLIAELTNERDWLRSRVQELEKQVLALTDAAAYRRIHPTGAPEPPAGERIKTLLETRTETYRPEKSLEEVRASFPDES